MAAFARLPELVRDAKLEATFLPTARNPDIITHTKFIDRHTIHKEQWQRVECLGHGGYGRVWLEKGGHGSTTPHKARAVKELLIHKKNVRRGDYVRELEALAKFSQDKYVDFFVRLNGWFEGEHALFIAMEYCEHGDLKNHLQEHGKLPEVEAQDIAWQVLRGLLFMHENGFAHRDLKPANILIKAKPPDHWRVKICDLGLSKRIESDNMSTTIKGTPGFIPPELILGIGTGPKNVDPQAADMWCFGETIYYMLTRQPTFEGDLALLNYQREVITFPYEPLTKYGASIAVFDFLRSLMAPQPRQRLTAERAILHPWVAATTNEGETISNSPEATNYPHNIKIMSRTRGITMASGEWTAAANLGRLASDTKRSSNATETTTNRLISTSSTLASGAWTNTIPLTGDMVTSRNSIEHELSPIISTSSEYNAKEDPPTSTIFVGSLDFNLTEDDFRDVFIKFGPILSARIIRGSSTGRSRGYGFITYDSTANADKAIRLMDGALILSRHVKCSKAHKSYLRGNARRDIYESPSTSHPAEEEIKNTFTPTGHGQNELAYASTDTVRLMDDETMQESEQSSMEPATMRDSEAKAPEKSTSSPERDILVSFKAFAERQKALAEQKRLNISKARTAKADKEVKLKDLKDFGSRFILPTPMPIDLVPILAKDPIKQKEIQERTAREAAEYHRGKAESKNMKEYRKPRDTAKPPETVTTWNQLGSTSSQHHGAESAMSKGGKKTADQETPFQELGPKPTWSQMAWRQAPNPKTPFY